MKAIPTIHIYFTSLGLLFYLDFAKITLINNEVINSKCSDILGTSSSYRILEIRSPPSNSLGKVGLVFFFIDQNPLKNFDLKKKK